jgi:hypothetical protein
MYKNIHVYKNTYMHNILIQIKKKNMSSIWPSHSIPNYIPERNENICPHKHLYKIDKVKQRKIPSTDK